MTSFGGWLDSLFRKSLGVEDWPNFGFDSLATEYFGSVNSGYAKPNMADIPISGEILIGKYYTHRRFQDSRRASATAAS